MIYNIFLDDERIPSNVKWVKLPIIEWIIIRDYDSFSSTILKKGVPNFISFDHDLSCDIKNNINYNNFKEKTGYECAKWLVEYCMEKNLDFPEYTVHSMNPIGKQNIISLIDSYKKSKKL